MSLTREDTTRWLDAFSMRLVDLDEMSSEQIRTLRDEYCQFLTRVQDAFKTKPGDHCIAVRDLMQKLIDQTAEDGLDSDKTIEALSDAFDRFRRGIDRLPEDSSDVQQTSSQTQTSEEPGYDDESDESIFKDYLQEMEEYIEQLESDVLNLEENISDEGMIHSVFRLFHSIKGTAGIMEHRKLNKIAHETENLLDLARAHEITLDNDAIGVILESLDAIRSIIRSMEFDDQEEKIEDDRYQEILDGINQFIDRKLEGEEEPQPAPTQPEEESEPDETEESDEEPVFEMDEEEPEEESVETEPGYPKPEMIPEIVREAVEPEEKPIRDEKGRKTTFIRVNTLKLDNLIDMVGELVISANLVREDDAVKSAENLDFKKKVAQMNSVVSDLQKSSMGLRMIPVGSTFQKMKRVIRDYTRHSEKSISLDIRGSETEIDRNIVDQLYEPLVHLVRNCCDHGIEDRLTRKKAGKPEQGTVTLNAFHKGNTIVIDISDDGQGLNREAILKKGIEKGLVHKGEELDDGDIYRLIMLPGFSTAGKVTDISGRGVGMDVVNQNIKKLGGFIDIKSRPGKGSSFTISLPLTLAIMEGMLVHVAGELFVLPVMNVKRIIHPGKEDIKVVFGKGELVCVEDQHIPMVRLHRLFGLEAAEQDVEKSIAIIVSSVQRNYALMVDSLVGIQDIVIKSLGPKFRGLKGISGSTILGNGSIGLILDVNTLYPR